MNEQKHYEQKVRAQLEEWKAEIDRLTAKAHKAEADARIELDAHIDELRIRYEAARNKLAELGATSGEAWEDVKTGVELAAESLGEAVRSALSRFR